MGFSIPSDYGGGMQPSSLIFPTAGCWEVTARTPTDALRFVVMVHPASEFPFGPNGFVGPSPAASVWERLHRALRLPSVPAGGACAVSPPARASRIEGQVLGTGPVYADDADTPGTVPYLPALASEGREAHVVRWLAAPEYQGPVLVRGRRLDAAGEVLFGPTSGTAASELQLFQGATPAHPDWRVWRAETTVTGSGCYAYQVDGTNFSQVIVFRVVASSATPNA